MKTMTLEDVRRATGVEALEENEIGQIRFRAGLSLATKKRHLKSVYRAYRKAEVEWRWILGDMVNDLFLPYGQKKSFCRDAYGERQGNTLYGYSLTAAHWNDHSRDFEGIQWSLFKESGPMPIDVRLDVIARVKRRELTPDNALEFCAKYKRDHRPTGSTGADFEIKNAQKQAELTGSTPPISITTILEPAALIHAVQCINTPAGLNALQKAIDARRSELQDDTDTFAEEE